MERDDLRPLLTVEHRRGHDQGERTHPVADQRPVAAAPSGLFRLAVGQAFARLADVRAVRDAFA